MPLINDVSISLSSKFPNDNLGQDSTPISFRRQAPILKLAKSRRGEFPAIQTSDLSSNSNASKSLFGPSQKSPKLSLNLKNTSILSPSATPRNVGDRFALSSPSTPTTLSPVTKNAHATFFNNSQIEEGSPAVTKLKRRKKGRSNTICAEKKGTGNNNNATNTESNIVNHRRLTSSPKELAALYVPKGGLYSPKKRQTIVGSSSTVRLGSLIKSTSGRIKVDQAMRTRKMSRDISALKTTSPKTTQPKFKLPKDLLSTNSPSFFIKKFANEQNGKRKTISRRDALLNLKRVTKQEANGTMTDDSGDFNKKELYEGLFNSQIESNGEDSLDELSIGPSFDDEVCFFEKSGKNCSQNEILIENSMEVTLPTTATENGLTTLSSGRGTFKSLGSLNSSPVLQRKRLKTSSPYSKGKLLHLGSVEAKKKLSSSFKKKLASARSTSEHRLATMKVPEGLGETRLFSSHARHSSLADLHLNLQTKRKATVPRIDLTSLQKLSPSLNGGQSTADTVKSKSPSIPKLDLKPSVVTSDRSDIGFHQEFMRQLPEFSDSWREAIDKEERN